MKKIVMGQKFGKLTVISKAERVKCGKRYWGAWNVECECGETRIIKTILLNRGRRNSCGCEDRAFKKGEKIHRLTTLSYKNGRWLCKCDCGKEVNVLTENLKGNTKSCGCLKRELSVKKAEEMTKKIRKYEPRIASARRRWKSYCYADKQCNIKFEEFLEISQKDCTYCGIQPSTRFNYFTKAKESSIKAIEEGLFIYNGLDRVDSNLPHLIDNVVSCCYLCNRSKNNRTVEVFKKWVNDLNIKDFAPITINWLEIPKGSLGVSIRCIYKNYNDGGLKIEEFYEISQNPCFYCNNNGSNLFNRAKTDKKSSIKAKLEGNFKYNGLDRIDSNEGHTIDNVVPCCKYCNFAKSGLSLLEFNDWIKRIKGIK